MKIANKLRKQRTFVYYARQQGRELAEVANEIGASLVAVSSIKAALDIDWDNPQSRTQALGMLINTLEMLQAHLEPQTELCELEQVAHSLSAARQVRAQDVELSSDGAYKLRQGVAKQRRISIEDPDMRHGRKSRSVRVDGYKRHVLKDLDNGLVRAVGITPASPFNANK